MLAAPHFPSQVSSHLAQARRGNLSKTPWLDCHELVVRVVFHRPVIFEVLPSMYHLLCCSVVILLYSAHTITSSLNSSASCVSTGPNVGECRKIKSAAEAQRSMNTRTVTFVPDQCTRRSTCTPPLAEQPTRPYLLQITVSWRIKFTAC